METGRPDDLTSYAYDAMAIGQITDDRNIDHFRHDLLGRRVSQTAQTAE
jgi:hypothetical protein